MEWGRPNLEEFAATLLELAREDPDILAVTTDSRGSGKLGQFARELPTQIIEIGIAEQNAVGIAAGLASCGKKVFSVSPASFLSARALEQVKNDVAYSDHPVKLIAISAGVSYGALGSTHHSLHDYAALRGINNIDIVAPADNFETREVIRAAVDHPKPIYIRFGKKPLPHLHAPGSRFQIGKALAIRKVESEVDLTFIGIGEAVPRALEASLLLDEEGIQTEVLSMHTLRPFDEESLLRASRRSRAVITVEEHLIHGGLGDACGTLLMKAGARVKFQPVAIPDEYTMTGSQQEILGHYGISGEGLARTARSLLGD